MAKSVSATLTRRAMLGAGVAALALPSLHLRVARAETIVEGDLIAERVADGLTHPWAVQVLPDDALIVTERPGTMRIVETNGRLSAPLANVPEVAEIGQGGLLDLLLAPDFPTSDRLFFSYAKPVRGGATTAVARARLDRANNRLTDVDDIFVMTPASGGGRHFGSRVVLARDGTLMITTGDRGDANRAQNFEDHAGAVIRINTDGSIPSDNPFVNGGGLPQIYSKGHRNPQGAAVDPATGEYYTVSHGARGGDEINRPEKGRNYGWPTITYGRDYSGASIGVGTEQEGLEQPLFFWDPSIAPSGLAIYRGRMFPEWDGDFFVGALAGQALVQVTRRDGPFREVARHFEGRLGRIRDVREHPSDGSLLLAIDDAPGQIVRVRRNA